MDQDEPTVEPEPLDAEPPCTAEEEGGPSTALVLWREASLVGQKVVMPPRKPTSVAMPCSVCGRPLPEVGGGREWTEEGGPVYVCEGCFPTLTPRQKRRAKKRWRFPHR
jgi:hypothetical protein